MESKFKPGDKVIVKGYGAPYWISKENYKDMAKAEAAWSTTQRQLRYGQAYPPAMPKEKPDNIISEDETTWICDMLPDIVGKLGIVKGCYADLYGHQLMGGPKEADYKTYSVDGIPSKSAWYDENQLELA